MLCLLKHQALPWTHLSFPLGFLTVGRGSPPPRQSFLPQAGFCSHELQILVKIRTTSRKFLKVSLKINSFMLCSIFKILVFLLQCPMSGSQVVIGGTKSFIRREKFWWERRAPVIEKPACWERFAAPPAAITIVS